MIEYTVEVYDNGEKYWYLNGKRHREDGPAHECNGYKEWCLNDKLHREDGPAVEKADGYKAWHLNGKLHREDGPAVEEVNNSYKVWYLNDEQVTEEEHKRRTSKDTCSGKVVEVDGVKYELKEV